MPGSILDKIQADPDFARLSPQGKRQYLREVLGKDEDYRALSSTGQAQFANEIYRRYPDPAKPSATMASAPKEPSQELAPQEYDKQGRPLPRKTYAERYPPAKPRGIYAAPEVKTSAIEKGLAKVSEVLSVPSGIVKAGVLLPAEVALRQKMGATRNKADVAAQKKTLGLPFWQRVQALKQQDLRTLGMTPETQARQRWLDTKGKPLEQALAAIGGFGAELGIDPTTLLAGAGGAVAKKAAEKTTAKLGAKAGAKVATAGKVVNKSAQAAFTTQQLATGLPQLKKGVAEGDPRAITEGLLASVFGLLGAAHLTNAPERVGTALENRKAAKATEKRPGDVGRVKVGEPLAGRITPSPGLSVKEGVPIAKSKQAHSEELSPGMVGTAPGETPASVQKTIKPFTPPVVSPEGQRVFRGVRPQEQEAAVPDWRTTDTDPRRVQMRQAAAPAPVESAAPIISEKMKPEDIGVLEGMQYKREGVTDTENAVSDKLKGTDVYDVDQGGTLDVWEDVNGKRWAGNAHHRTELAKRADKFVKMTPEGQVEVPREVPVNVLREADGWTKEKARGYFALKNIREGTGTALDALEVTRSLGFGTQDYKKIGISLTSDMGRNLAGLHTLDEQSLLRVKMGDIPEHVAAGIGSVEGLTPEAQRGAINDAIGSNIGTYARGKRLAEHYLADQQSGRLAQESANDLFGGEFSTATSTRGIRVDLEDAAKRILSAQRSELLKPADAKLRAGESIDAAGRKADAARMAESQRALSERLDLLYRQESIQNTIADLAGEVGNGKLTRQQAGQHLAALLEPHTGRSVKTLADPGGVQLSDRPGGVGADAGKADLFGEPPTAESAANVPRAPAAETAPNKKQSVTPVPFPKLAEPAPTPIPLAKASPTPEIAPEKNAPAPPKLSEKALSVLDTIEQGAKSRLKPGGLSSRIDAGLVDYAIIGAVKLAKGAVKFADWSASMIAEHGEGLRDRLEEIWQASHDYYHESLRPRVAELPVLQNPPESAISPEAKAKTTITGAKNATTEAERTQRGQSPIERQAYTLVRNAYSQGKAAVESGRTEPRGLAQSVADKPRPLSAEEVGALAYDRARIITEHDNATAELAKAVDRGDAAKIAELQAAQERLLADLDTNDNALVKGGREQSAAFNARKMMVGQDFSFAGVQQRAKAAAARPLTKEERTNFEGLTAKLKEKEAQIAAVQAELSAAMERNKELEAQRSVQRMARDEALSTRQAGRAKTKEKLDAEFSTLRNEFVKKASKVSAGIDPELLPIVRQMARNRVAAGINTVSGLVDALHAELVNVLPDLEKREVRDALSGYGQAASRNTSELTKRLSDLQKQARLLSAIEDAEKNIPVAKGQTPGRPSPEVQRLRKQLDAELERQGVKQKPTWSNEARQSMKERVLRTQIADLERRLKVGDYSPQAKKAGAPDTPELAKLKAQLSNLQEKFNAAKNPNPLTPEQRKEQGRMKAQETRLQKQIEEIEARIQAKDFSTKPTTPIPETPETAKMKAKLATLREEYNKIKPPPDVAARQAKAEQAYKVRLEAQIAELGEKIKKGDFTLSARPPRPEASIQIKALQVQRDRLKAQITKEIEQMRPRTFWEKLAAYQKANLLSSPKGALVDAFSTGVWQAVDNTVMRSLRGSPAEAYHALRGMAASLPHALTEMGETIKAGYGERAAKRLDLPSHYELPGGLKNPLNVPSRIRAGVNEGQRAVAEGAELYAQAYKVVKREGAANVRQRMAELVADPTEAMQQAMQQYGDEATFTQAPDSVARGINNLRFTQVGSARPFEFVVPFFNTVYNLTKTGVQTSPFGFATLLSKEVRSDPAARRQAITRAAVGTGIMALLSTKAQNGEMTGGVPDDDAERAKFFADGKQAYSVKIGNRWVEYKNLGPLVVPMAMTAALWQNYEKTKQGIKDADILRAAASMARVPIEQVNMFTVKQLLDGGTDANKIIGGLASTLTPLSSAQRMAGNATDDWQRDPAKWYEFVMAGMPVVREQLPIKTAGQGKNEKPIPNPQKGLNALLPVQTKVWTPPVEKSPIEQWKAERRRQLDAARRQPGAR